MSDEMMQVHVSKPASYEPGPRVVAALEELTSALLEEAEDKVEVSGFAQLSLGAGLSPRLTGPEPLEFCAGYYGAGGKTGDSGSREREVCYGIFF